MRAPTLHAGLFFIRIGPASGEPSGAALKDAGVSVMDASARIRRILWGTLRGTVPAPRALDMMVRWEANFAPDFERDPTQTVTRFLLQELGGNLNRADCSALADRILSIMDDFSGPLPQDPIASIRRLSEARLSAQPAPAPTAAPAAARAETPVEAATMVAAPKAVATPVGAEVAEIPKIIEPAEHEALATAADPVDQVLPGPEPGSEPEPESDEPALAPESVGAEPVLAEMVTPVEHEPPSDALMDPVSAGEAAILLDAHHAEAEPVEFVEPMRRSGHGNVIDHEMVADPGMAHLPISAWPVTPDPVTAVPQPIITAPNGRVLASDAGVDPEYYEMALRVPRGFESARTLEILPPEDEPDLRADGAPDRGAALEADWDADWNSDPAWNPDPKPELNSGLNHRPADDTEIPPPPRPPKAEPSAPYGIDRSVFASIFLEHD